MSGCRVLLWGRSLPWLMAREGGGVEKPLLPMGVGGGGDLQLDFYNLFDIGGEL